MSTAEPEPAEVVAALRRAGVAEVDGTPLARALYSSDASLYRVPPLAVVRPHHEDEVMATLQACRELGVPFTARGAGTSIAGNAVGPGVVVDFSRHLNRVVAVDPDARVATVQPGVVHARLQDVATGHGLRFGPDPSSHNRCTIGGMIANNACGSRALGYGRTSDNVERLDVVTGTGERLRLVAGGGSHPAPQPASLALGALRSLVAADLATIRTEFGRFARQGSGYALEHLLPERNFDVARALVGSEGTLAVVLGASVRLVADPPVRRLVVLGYPNMAEAADAVTAILPHRPTACEGLDSRIVDRLRMAGRPVPPLPRGQGWLFVEVAGESLGDVSRTAARVVADSDALDSLLVVDPVQAGVLWRIREDGAGLAAKTPDGEPAHAGWEDAAVPPAVLGRYLRRFEGLLEEYDLTGLPYGHFGDGCVHVRIDFPLTHPDGPARFRAFLLDAARLVAEFGGSISGEHGDGRARSELLPYMYSQPARDLFALVKGVFDPDNVLNPGVLVDPRPVDADLRVSAVPPTRERLALAYHHDRGDFATAVHRCTGVGKCRADTTAVGGVMCPSYLATREEKDSTRGRARVLQEMIHPGSEVRGWRAPEVHAALELCLACKGCLTDCPNGVDMASYKSEVLYQSYRRRPRPRSHYLLGRLPRWADLAAKAPRLANAALRSRFLGRAGRALAGVDRRRNLPLFAKQTFMAWWRSRERPSDAGVGWRGPVVVWIDSFTDHFSPEVGQAAVAVLEHAGYRVLVPPRQLCCGLTWITTGQLDQARRILRHTVDELRAPVQEGIPIVGLEPSCTAVLRSDALELVEGPSANQVGAATRTLAELLAATPDWHPPSLAGTTIVAQPHCHHHAVMGWTPDELLLTNAGAALTRVGGCCGLAGNWGVEDGHQDVSVAIAEHALLPAVRAYPDAALLADGFSCRTQLADLADRRGQHLAQLLAERLHE